MNTKALSEQFWRQGYLVIEDFFPKPMMREMNQLILAHFGDDPGYEHEKDFLHRSHTEVIPWFPQREGVQAFNRVDEDMTLQTLTQAILGDGWQNDYSMVMFSKRGTAGQAWHQDCAPDNREQFNLNRLVYSDDITDEIGGQIVVVPGSHRRGLLPSGDPTGEFPGQRVLRPRAGTLLLLHGHCWHRVLPVNGAYRFSTNYRAKSPAAPEHITDVCVYRNMRYRFSTASVVEERPGS